LVIMQKAYELNIFFYLVNQMKKYRTHQVSCLMVNPTE
jgi:hypothetical protein